MFHTVELFRKINSLEYYHLNNSLRALSKRNKTRYFEEDNNEVIFLLFSENGITIKLTEHQIDEYMYHQIIIRFTPKRLLKEKEFIEVVREEELKSVRTKFKKIMNELKKEFKSRAKKIRIFNFNDLENYNVRRIDFCINIYSKNCKETFKLIKRADIPKKFNPYLKYDKIKKRKIMPKNSFYIISKSVGINIYLKYEQMKNDEYFKDIDISAAEGIIRFEIQCYSQKVNNIKDKYKLDGKTIFNIANNRIAKETLLYYLEKTMGLEDYCTLSEAREIIGDSKINTQRIKNEMICIIELINEKKSIPKAREEFSGGKTRFNMLLEKIEKLNINPITIPINWGINNLLNPINEIKKELI